MAEYKGIKGFKTQSYATDPVATGVAGATWTTSNDMLQGRYGAGGCGTQTAGFICNGVGGGPGGDIGVITNCETYDGTCWSEGNNMLVGRGSAAMAGTTTAAVYAGGFPGSFATSETWDGTSWTETNNITTGRGDFGVCGTQTAMLVWGGWTGSVQDLCEEYDGTCWSESGDLGTGRYYAQGFGIQTLALAGEGGPAPAGRVCEEYDGSTWSSGTAFNTNRMYGAAAGTFTAGLVIAGQSPGTIANTESWNGSAWTERADVNTGRTALNPQNIGTQVAALIGSGAVPPTTNVTEEFNEAGADSTLLNEGQIWYNTTGGALKYTAIAAGTWASAPSINTTRAFGGGLGIQTAAMFVGGSGGASSGNETETYDGSAWTTKNTINTTRNRMGVATQSPNAASLIFGGSYPNSAPGYKNQTETFDGTSWTTVPATLNTSRREFGGSAGASNSAALGFSGYTTTYITNVEEYNGSTWAEESDVNTARGVGGGGGTSADALFVAGLTPSFSAATETWDGTSWTTGNNANNARSYFGSGVTSSTSGLIFGGDAGPTPAAIDDKTEQWDGTSWTELADLAQQMEGCKGCGTSTLALAFGGYDSGGYLTATESWDQTILTVKTVTVS